VLDENPQLWQAIGNLSALSEAVLIDVIAGIDRLLAESLKRNVADIREELLGQNPSVLAKLTADRVVACYLTVNLGDVKAANAKGSLPHCRYWLKFQQQASNQYDQALKTLALLKQKVPAALIASPPGNDPDKDIGKQHTCRPRHALG
jgi:hypothetical protein